MHEASTTANVPGYQTPYAFSGGLAKNKKKKKDLIKRLHMKLVGKLDEGYSINETPQMAKKGQVGLLLKLANKQLQNVFSLHKKGKNKEAKVVFNNKVYSTLEYIHRAFDNLNESVNEGRYHEYRNDETRTPKQKIWHSVREVRDSLMKLERNLKHAIKLKNEQGMDSRTYYKYAQNSFPKIQEKLIKMAKRIGELSA